MYVHYGQLAEMSRANFGDVANLGFVVGERCVAGQVIGRRGAEQVIAPSARLAGHRSEGSSRYLCGRCATISAWIRRSF